MRRLPIYFLIDVSESMVGEPIDLMQEGMGNIIRELRTDPYALETVWISVIAFAGQAKTIAPLQEVAMFYPPKFPVGSGTSLCSGLGHLMYEMKKNIVPTTIEQKGDWKPIVFLFTDGVPTDSASDLKAVISEWKKKWQNAAHMIVVSFGKHTDAHLLSELTENVLYFDNTDASAYAQFFKWVSSSIKTGSVNVENNATEFELGQLNDSISKIDLSKKGGQPVVDDNFVVLAAKCQNTKQPYLIKYRKNVFENDDGDIALEYRLVGAFRVDNTYFEMSDEKAVELKINTDKLIGAPTCPCCGNQYGFAYDGSCDKIHCIGSEKISTCPWCGNKSHYDSGDDGFDVHRTRG